MNVFLVAILLLVPSCLNRYIQIDTTPQNATIFLDGKDIGQSPVEVPFQYFGTREVVAVKDGFARTKLLVPMEASWYDYFPFDFINEVLILFPRTDIRAIHLQLRPSINSFSGDSKQKSEEQAAAELLQRAKELQTWVPGKEVPKRK